MKRLFFLLLLGILACGLFPTPQPDSAPTQTAVPSATPTSTAPPPAPLGSAKNPLILALPPSARPTQDVIDAGNLLVSKLEASTGYQIVTVIPPTETDLVKGFGIHNVHIGVLTPFGYLLASDQGSVNAIFGRQQDGKLFYGAQFLALHDSGFISYYDPVKGQNIAEASQALMQFNGKKPCWTDDTSPSGYVVPLGYLNQAGVQTIAPAFVAGHPTVVRALVGGGVCDFGATYIDARAYPGLQDAYPDVMQKIMVVWRIPPIIPYETLVFSPDINIDMRRALIRGFVDFISTSDGAAAMQKLYGITAMAVVQDGQYDEFRKLVKASGLELNTLVK